MAGDPLGLFSEDKTPAVKVFKCPKCTGNIELRAPGHSMSAICSSCSRIVDTSDENNLRIINSTKESIRRQVIPLGARGSLRGTTWEVIGYMERTDGSGTYPWSEYLLFNPQKSFHWLTEFDGHWNFVFTSKTKPDIDNSSPLSPLKIKYLGKTFNLYLKGLAKVKYVAGEFYWQVKHGDQVEVTDYVAAPEILSLEKNEGEEIWSLGTYISPDDVKKAFKIDQSMPNRIGIAPNQPSSFHGDIVTVLWYWILFIGLLLLLQMGFMMSAKHQIVFNEEIEVRANDKIRQYVSTPFDLEHGTANLEFQAFSKVENRWIELQNTLIDETNGNTEDFEVGIEYYFGIDSDGPWKEGSQISSRILSSVPDGKYHLEIDVSGEGLPIFAPANSQSGQAPDDTPPEPAPLSFKNKSTAAPSPNDVLVKIEVFRDVITWSNFLWAACLLTIWPLLLVWRNYNFEVRRWEQSDFSPYARMKEDDE